MSWIFKRIIFDFLTFKSTLSLLKDFIYLFLERGEEREKERENHQCVVASHNPSTRDPTHNPGTCPDWESER